jgi:hypothetical protein
MQPNKRLKVTSAFENLHNDLRTRLGVDKAGLRAFIDYLDRLGACISGSYPLWFMCQPELQTAWPGVVQRVATWQKCVGGQFPPDLLETIQRLVRQADHEEFGNSLDIDVFVLRSHAGGQGIQWPGPMAEWKLSEEVLLYAHDSRWFDSKRYVRQGCLTTLNVIMINNQWGDSELLSEHIKKFDFDVCQGCLWPRNGRLLPEYGVPLSSMQGYVDLSVRGMQAYFDLAGHSTHMSTRLERIEFDPMRAITFYNDHFAASLAKPELLERLLELQLQTAIAHEAIDVLWHMEQRTLDAEQVLRRTQKYQRRGFLILNQAEVDAFVFFATWPLPKLERVLIIKFRDDEWTEQMELSCEILKRIAPRHGFDKVWVRFIEYH